MELRNPLTKKSFFVGEQPSTCSVYILIIIYLFMYLLFTLIYFFIIIIFLLYIKHDKLGFTTFTNTERKVENTGSRNRRKRIVKLCAN